ncbi:MAGE-domain-containing protein [Agrocybe pediades]|nr:MAGE-domain-containing protein [Agrocybe pediades]
MARSGARAGPSQSQSQRPGQSQARGSRRQARVEDSEEEEEQVQEQDDGEPMDLDGDDFETARKVSALVRLALFTEHKRVPLRREEINKKALGTSSRAFNHILELAQQKLRNTFGMELVELPSRAALENGADEEGSKETATGMKKKASAVGSKTYILRSCLDPALVERAALADEDTLAEEQGDLATHYPAVDFEDEDLVIDDSPEAERIPQNYGTLLSWTRGDQLGSLGILYTILALILVHGRAAPDAELRRHLKTLHLPSTGGKPVLNTATATERAQDLNEFLGNLLKLGYLDRQQIGGDAKKGKKTGTGVKRVRNQADEQEAGITYEWRWGPRSFCEVGEENIAQFIAEFMVQNDNDEQEEGAGGARDRNRQQERLKKMYTGVEKAAGGKLAELM